jgi:hyaluronan synthase
MFWSVYFPLGALGIFRWCCWLVYRIPASFYRPIVNGHREPITIVTPVYQEDPDLFQQALYSWLRNRVDEIICVIDVTDTECEAIARSLGVTIVMTDVPGKRDALRKGWEAATTPIVALVDSDTIWADDVAARVCEPFLDSEIGGVGTCQNALDPVGLWQNVADMYLDYRYFCEIAAESQVGQAVSCLSGRTAVYRRSVLEEIKEEFMAETFLGVQCLSGDDKRLTMLTLKAGYKTVLQRNARVWSTFPSKFTKVLKQRTRWARNTWRSDLRSIGEGWLFRHKMLTFIIFNKIVSGFFLLFSFYLLVAVAVHHSWFLFATIIAWWAISRSAKILPHLHRRPENLRLIPAFIGVSLMMALIKLYALCTVRRQMWSTRQVAVVDGVIQRTGEGQP